MNKRLVSRILAVVVVLVAALIMAGWIFNVPILRTLTSWGGTTRFISAICFLLSGILILLLSKQDIGEASKFFILIISYSILLLMILFIVTTFLGVSTGIESLFFVEAVGTSGSLIPGLPSLSSMFCFILLAVVGMVFIFDSKISRVLYFNGILVSVIGFIAFIGHILGVPFMYFSFLGYNIISSMASFLFVLLGASLFLIGKRDNPQ